MTKNITIKNPSKQLVEVFNSLKAKKEKQIEKLSHKEKCTVNIKV